MISDVARRRISDPEVLELASLSETLQSDYVSVASDPWEGSPFAWILKTPSRTKGAIGEKLVSAWCALKEFDVIKSRNTEADRIIEGHKVEIKLSTLWAGGGFKFQQIRDQDYDYCFCLGLSPFNANGWFIPKSALREWVIGHTGQHTGAAGTDTAWLGFQADSPPSWLSSHGGSLSDLRVAIEQCGRGESA